MSVGKKLFYETPLGLCTVVGIRGGQLMEIRRFGKKFVSEAVDAPLWLRKAKEDPSLVRV